MHRHTTGSPVTVASVTVLLGVNVVTPLLPRRAGLIIGPSSAALLVRLARRSGLSWDDLGMGRSTWQRGARWAGGACALVAAVYAAGAAVPATRAAFLDPHYRAGAGRAIVSGLVVVPLATVLPEEIGFRGVVWAALHRDHGLRSATIWSSVLFGLWHVLPTLSRASPALVVALGGGARSRAATAGAGVIATGLANVLFCELRRRTGSLLAPAGLHWATNGLGVLVSAVAWGLRGGRLTVRS
jgi:membrane protease YdiL (CAAX protease family)